ncbi:MAG: 1-deoxy-D-xylulose-5-phosphate synthase [candidate division WOR-3 bacterium]
MGLLERIDSPVSLRSLSLAELRILAQEIRELIVKTVAKNGGHLAPNLGVVELTLALHRTFDTPEDWIIWDVGHQCYTHKIITGRRERFATLRLVKGIAGFPKRIESEYDVFDTGHSGDSISAALGMVTGLRRQGKRRRVIAVIGDGSIVTGMALEALNHAGSLKEDLIVVLNDNEMSIAHTTGAIATYLNQVITGRVYNRLRDDAWQLLGHLPRDLSERARLAAHKLQEGLKNLIVPSILFEELGFRYIGPVDGHNLGKLIETFQRVKALRGPVLVHIVTRKGEGYEPARKNPEQFHGIGPFDVATGAPTGRRLPTFTERFGAKMVELAEIDKRVVAITAGMCLGTGLKEFRERFPERFFDVGICEQHAVTFAAGLAQVGLKPVVAIYSTFLLRALDQILQDVCLQGLPVVFAIDRAGLVGEDGPTHHGVYDLSYLTMFPNMVVTAPRDGDELNRLLEFAVAYQNGPVAIRYPRGEVAEIKAATQEEEPKRVIEIGKGEVLRKGADGAVLAVGSAVGWAMKAAELLTAKGVNVTVADGRFVKPVDEELIINLARINRKLLTVEENTLLGGFGNLVSLVIEKRGLSCQLKRMGIEDRFVEHGPREWLLEECRLSPQWLAEIMHKFFTEPG